MTTHTPEISHENEIIIDDIHYIIIKAVAVKQKVGRPKKGQAQCTLHLRRRNGKNTYISHLYSDGTCCEPF